MKSIGIVALALVAALVLGFGTRLGGTNTAYADADAIQIIGCELIAGGIDGTLDDVTVGTDYDRAGCTGETFAGLFDLDGVGGVNDTKSGMLDKAYGDGDGTLEPSDLETQDGYDGNQIGENCTAAAIQCTLLVFAYVDDEAPVTFDPPAGLQTLENGSINWVCDDEGAGEDEDCDDVALPPNNGDGVVVAHLLNDTADAGDSLEVQVDQETITVSDDVNVVGIADDVEITLVEDVIQTSDSSTDVSDCIDDGDVLDSLGEPNITTAIITIVDSDGEPLARQSAVVVSSDKDVAEIGKGTPGGATGNTGQTIVVGDAIAQYVVICGDTDTGTSDITATIFPTLPAEESASAEITVVGAPDSVALTASPAVIACDGTQTATVTAVVTDSDGNNVADGVDVRFSVVALGTANPINTTTTDGTSTSVITPLANASAGVTVSVSAGNGDAEASIRVDCSIPIPAQPTPVTTPVGTIGPPDTGSGGYLGQDSSAGFPLWTLFALALGSVALVAGGMVTRKVSK